LRRTTLRWTPPLAAPADIFNLGHGISPETPVDHVRTMADAVHDISRR
jgi:uroporphyrinogen-III decarboxylase